MDVTAKSRFEQAAKVLSLDPDTAARSWGQLRDLGITPDDPTTIFIGVAGYVDQVTRKLPQEMEEAARRATATINATADKAVLAAAAQIKASHSKTVEEVSTKIAESAEKALTQKVRTFDRNSILAAALALVMIAAGTGYAGFKMGQADTAQVAAELQSALSRNDGRTWLNMMAINDLSGAIAHYCAPGSPRVSVLDGGRACSVPLWLERSTIAPAGAGVFAQLDRLHYAIADHLGRLHPLWVLLGGFLLATLARKLARGFAAWPPIAWLLDIQPRAKN